MQYKQSLTAAYTTGQSNLIAASATAIKLKYQHHNQNKIKMKTKLLIVFTTLYSITNAQTAWTQKADFGGTGRAGAVGFSIGAKGYIGTGTEGGGSSGPNRNDFWEWDQSTDTWMQMADFAGTARSYAVGFSIGTKGYIGTGYDGTDKKKDFWEWSQSNNTWIQKASFGGTARYCSVGFSINSKGYIGTGYDDTGSTRNDFWEWDQAGDTWVQKTAVGNVARGEAVGFSIGAKGYIGTGQDASSVLMKDFWEWDQTAGSWTQMADFGGTARRNAVGFNVDTKGYIGTGYDGAGSKKDIWEWDQANNVWLQKTNFGGTTRSQAIAFSIGTVGYVGTGNPGNATKDFWAFDPSVVTGINEVKIDNSISVYPNPFSLETTLKTSSTLENATLTVYNSSGQQVKQSENISGQTITFQRDNLPGGLYFISVTQENKIIVIDKLVITDN